VKWKIVTPGDGYDSPMDYMLVHGYKRINVLITYRGHPRAGRIEEVNGSDDYYSPDFSAIETWAWGDWQMLVEDTDGISGMAELPNLVDEQLDRKEPGDVLLNHG